MTAKTKVTATCSECGTTWDIDPTRYHYWVCLCGAVHERPTKQNGWTS